MHSCTRRNTYIQFEVVVFPPRLLPIAMFFIFSIRWIFLHLPRISRNQHSRRCGFSFSIACTSANIFRCCCCCCHYLNLLLSAHFTNTHIFFSCVPCVHKQCHRQRTHEKHAVCAKCMRRSSPRTATDLSRCRTCFCPFVSEQRAETKNNSDANRRRKRNYSYKSHSVENERTKTRSRSTQNTKYRNAKIAI